MFFLVDSFTDSPFKGNPAGVCIVDDFANDSELQKIASYYNWSEIAFVKQTGKDEFIIRWFSPLDEAPLCGHATLAASHIIFSKGLAKGNTINFKYKSGLIIATIDSLTREIKMQFPVKPIQRCEKFPFSVKKIIGIKNYIEILKDDKLYVVVLKTPEDIKNAIPDFDEIKKIDARAIAITSQCSGNFDFSSRYFAPKVGIYEDPVCGSMHCRLAYYWKNILQKNNFVAYQDSKRTGVLFIEIKDEIVNISGKAVTICEII